MLPIDFFLETIWNISQIDANFVMVGCAFNHQDPI